IRRVEVNAPEVVTIANFGDPQALAKQVLTPRAELLIIIGAEGDVMGLTRSFPRLARHVIDAEERHIAGRQDPRAVVIRPEVVEIIGRVLVDRLLDKPEAERLFLKLTVRPEISRITGDVVESPQIHPGRDRL